MFARATSGDQKNNRLFSPCSRSKMDGVMNVKGRCDAAKCCFKGKVFKLNWQAETNNFKTTCQGPRSKIVSGGGGGGAQA